MSGETVTLFLSGDVMLGRGIDQVMPRPGDPRIEEPVLTSALDYVALAERAHGPIPRPADFDYVWGDALEALERARPDARIVNLETSVTRDGAPVPKGINYRMSPANLGCLAAARITCCVLANNHVLDWGEAGLRDTLESLDRAGIRHAGAGRTVAEARAPAVLTPVGGPRILVYGFGATTSGIPETWGAAPGRPGVNLLPGLSERTARHVADAMTEARRPGTLVVASIHWGPNWGYDIPAREREFAHRLIESGAADVIHGHSSHHPKGIEVYRGRLILYGCGDFVNDYEGIAGHEAYRGDLVLMYLPRLDAATGRLAALSLVPLRLRNFRLGQAPPDDAAWLAATLDREGARLGTRVAVAGDGTLSVRWTGDRRRRQADLA